ncbi:MAG: thioredoxin [Firmicutes bacterium]|nr:thioredoxin [Bacillota bacterium]
MSQIQEVGNANFNDVVIASDKPVLVDFYATWCGPCKMLNPVLEAVSEAVGDKVVIAKCDIDKSMEIAQEYELMNVPTLILYNNGEEADRAIGFKQKNQLLEMIKKVVDLK